MPRLDTTSSEVSAGLGRLVPMFRARVLSVVVAALCMLAAGRPASAQEAVPARLHLQAIHFTSAPPRVPPLRLQIAAPAQMPAIVERRPDSNHKGLLSALYATTVVMQGLDVHSTLMAFDAGAVEGNPIMGGVTRNVGTFVATKAAVAAGVIFMSQRIAKKNKVAAIITLVAVNSAYAAIVAHNYRLANGR